MLLLVFAFCLLSFACVVVSGCVCSGAGFVVVALRVVVTAGGLPPNLETKTNPTALLPTYSVIKIFLTLSEASCWEREARISG